MISVVTSLSLQSRENGDGNSGLSDCLTLWYQLYNVSPQVVDWVRAIIWWVQQVLCPMQNISNASQLFISFQEIYQPPPQFNPWNMLSPDSCPTGPCSWIGESGWWFPWETEFWCEFPILSFEIWILFFPPSAAHLCGASCFPTPCSLRKKKSSWRCDIWVSTQYFYRQTPGHFSFF